MKPTRPEPVSYELLFDERQNRRYGPLNLFYFASEAKEYMDAQEARIAELEALRDHDHCRMEKLEADNAELREEVERLRKAIHRGARR